MKTAFLTSASIAAVLLATGAQAADLGRRPVYKAAPPPVSVWSWTGVYVGANVGAVRGRSTIDNGPPGINGLWLPGPSSNNGTGFIGGLQAGYNWQISQAVIGIEGDISWSSLSRSTTVLTTGPDIYSSRLTWLGTIRGRLGWAFDRVLVYGTGGVAFANLSNQYTSLGGILFTATPESSRTGWTAGGGIEYAWTDHWTVKAEYLHVDLSSKNALSTAGSYAFVFKDRLDIGRVGINYKF
jgi:outer membrane immunogenic protein